MFDFFEDFVEGVEGIGAKLLDFIKEIITNSKGELNSNRDCAQIGSLGDYAQIGSSGACAQIGSSGYYAKIGSSGNYAKIGSSGYYAKIGSSGYSAKIGSSGDYAQIGSSGACAQIGSSGYSAKIGSSGDYAKIGSSGNSAQIDILGNNAIGFACGFRSIIRAKRGTWISLSEYQLNEGRWIPIFAASAQIGNKEYTDFRGRVLEETEYYCLHNKQFYPVDISDGIKIIKISEKKRDGITIIKGQGFNGDEMYLVKDKDLNAHGETLKQALEDLQYKKIKSEEVQNIVDEIKKTKKVTKAQYRAITGACQYGTNKFCEEHNLTGEKIDLEELRKILISDYGAEKFWGLIDGN